MGSFVDDEGADAVAIGAVMPSNPDGGRAAISRRRALLMLIGTAGAGGAGSACMAATENGSSDTRAEESDPTSLTETPQGQTGSSQGQSVLDPQPGRLPSLPNPAVSMWVNSFEQPTVQDLPADVLATLNVVVFAIAQSAKAGSGQLTWQPHTQEPDLAIAAIAQLVDSKTPVLIGIGGSDDGGITVVGDQQVSEFCESIRDLVRTYGFTGIDIDLEPSGGVWDQAAVVSAVRTLKAEYGRNFIVGLTVGLYGEHSARWTTLAQELGDDLDYWSPMLYDYPEAHDERLVADALSKTQLAIDGGVPANKHILGFMCNSYYNSSPVPVTAAVWHAVRAAHPDLRGAFIWESSLEREFDYAWTRQVGRTIRTDA